MSLNMKKKAFWLALIDERNLIFTANVQFEYDEVIQKGCNIKSYFNSEKQRMDTAKRSRAVADGHLESSWKFYEHLQFLQVVNAQSPSVNNFNKKILENLNYTSNLPREPGEKRKSDESFNLDHDVELSNAVIEDGTEFVSITTDVSISRTRNKRFQVTENTSPVDFFEKSLCIKQINFLILIQSGEFYSLKSY